MPVSPSVSPFAGSAVSGRAVSASDTQDIPFRPDAAVRLDVEPMVNAVFESIVDTVFPEYKEDRRFIDVLGRCVRGNVTAIVEIAAGRLALEDVEPESALELAGLAAEFGVALSNLERAYWVGVERFWREWFALSQVASERGAGTLDELLGSPTQALFGYVMRVLELVVSRYNAVLDELNSTRQDRQRQLLAELLDGSLTEHTPELDEAMGYRLRGIHVAMLLGPANRDMAEKVVARLRERTGARDTLLVPKGATTWEAWLGFPAGSGWERARTMRCAAESLDVPVSIGEPAEGITGLRRTHEQAERTAQLRAALSTAPTCLCYRDIRLEALLLDNEDEARVFVREELGELAADVDRARRIRETLLVWLSSGSQARAATELGVHENTVRLRIRCAGEVLGGALSERRAELLVALRLCDALGCNDTTESAP